SFVGTLKAELVQGRPFRTRFEAELAVARYLGWFNHTRLHSSLGDLSPTQFEIDHHPNKNRTEPLPANP
ncbi:MAG: IS3 family transposase, partial [Actinomycetota bacterium]|nr:IS3 family transposase [Actinomycetota bacterium]